MILSEHLVRSDTDGRDFRTNWWKWTFGRLQQIFMQVSRVRSAVGTFGDPWRLVVYRSCCTNR